MSQPYVPGSTPPYTPGTPYLPQVIGFLQLSTAPTDVILDGTLALVGTGSNVLIIDLTNPAQPVGGPVISGNFGSRLALDSNGILIAAGNTQSSSVQTATVGSACAGYRSQIKNGAPVANVTYPLTNLDWTIADGYLSDSASPFGFVLNGVSLGGRYMADQMSLPYVVIQRTPNQDTTPAYMECQLYPGGDGSAGACTNSPTSRSQLLQFQYVTSNPNYFALQAQFLVDRLDGDPDMNSQLPDSCIVVTQDYEFWKEGYDACEASDVLSCARFKPKATYNYYTNTGPAVNTVNVAQRFLFSPNSGYTAPPPTTSYPWATPDVAMLMYDCEHSNAASTLLAQAYGNAGAEQDAYPDCSGASKIFAVTANYPSGVNPLNTETAVRVIQNGQTAPVITATAPPTTGTLPFVRADNLHLRAAEGGMMISEPTTNGNPGCPECVHIHWRWGQLLGTNDPVGTTVVSPRFVNNGGYPMIPANSNQDVDVAVDLLNTSKTGLDSSGNLWASGQSISGGQPLALWYSGTGHSQSDTFFQHGGFFSSLRVSIGNPSAFGAQSLMPYFPLPSSFPCVPTLVLTGL
jgi:hypothetical protein